MVKHFQVIDWRGNWMCNRLIETCCTIFRDKPMTILLFCFTRITFGLGYVFKKGNLFRSRNRFSWTFEATNQVVMRQVTRLSVLGGLEFGWISWLTNSSIIIMKIIFSWWSILFLQMSYCCCQLNHISLNNIDIAEDVCQYFRYGWSIKKILYWWRDIITLCQVIDSSALIVNHFLNWKVMKVRLMEHLSLFLKCSSGFTLCFSTQYVMFLSS